MTERQSKAVLRALKNLNPMYTPEKWHIRNNNDPSPLLVTLAKTEFNADNLQGRPPLDTPDNELRDLLKEQMRREKEGKVGLFNPFLVCIPVLDSRC